MPSPSSLWAWQWQVGGGSRPVGARTGGEARRADVDTCPRSCSGPGIKRDSGKFSQVRGKGVGETRGQNGVLTIVPQPFLRGRGFVSDWGGVSFRARGRKPHPHRACVSSLDKWMLTQILTSKGCSGCGKEVA